MELREILEEQDWHPERVIENVPLLQAWWYGEVQKKRGRLVRRFAFFDGSEPKLFAQFIEYPLLNGLTYWYAPYGPVAKDLNKGLLAEFEKNLRQSASAAVAFIRLDFSPALSEEEKKNVRNIFTAVSKFSSAGSYYQPRYEWYTDISKSEDAILMSMHQKTRYSVRLSEKKGVKTEIVQGAELNDRLPEFLKLMDETAKRNGFGLHDEEYYKCFFDEIAKRGNGFLIEARCEEKLLAAHFVVIEGNIAHYVFGASSNDLKELCAPYLAHFEGMREAKKRGATFYNFGGISENGDAPHWESITVFKKKFGGSIVPHSPYFDVVLKPFWYHLYNFRKLIKRFV